MTTQFFVAETLLRILHIVVHNNRRVLIVGDIPDDLADDVRELLDRCLDDLEFTYAPRFSRP